MMIADLLSLANIVGIILVSAVGLYNQWKAALVIREPWRWIKFGLAIICLLWLIIYSAVLINFLGDRDETYALITRSWVIRPMILLTLAGIAASGVARRKTNGF